MVKQLGVEENELGKDTSFEELGLDSNGELEKRSRDINEYNKLKK